MGALTSKDFRFRQRVWYLKEADSICPGCSTGCNVKVSYNEEGLWRIKPRENKEVNGFWMCDTGRDSYSFVNLKARLLNGKVGKRDSWQEVAPADAARSAGLKLRETAEKFGADSVASGRHRPVHQRGVRRPIQRFFTQELKSKNIFHWLNNPDKVNEFDGLLFRGDRNPNTKGLVAALSTAGVIGKWEDLQSRISGKKIKVVLVAGPGKSSRLSRLGRKK